MYGNSEADSTLKRTSVNESGENRKVNLVAVGQLIRREGRCCCQEEEAAEEEKEAAPSEAPRLHLTLIWCLPV